MFYKSLTRVLVKSTNIFHQQSRLKMKLEFNQKIKGMKEIDKSLFHVKLVVPAIKIKKVEYGKARKLLKPFSLDAYVNARKYQDINPENELSNTHKYILLDPELFDFDSLEQSVKTELLQMMKSDNGEQKIENLIEKIKVELNYEDLKFEDVMKAILPDDLLNENITAKGYSVIGHIAHFNLKEKILEYKHIIGQVLIDKMPTIKTVVNKLNGIDNTYRNFSLEILAGEKDTSVTVKENACLFKFDFANVYWNPRLGFEHERVVKLLNSNDVIYDVFAGVGPFSIPAVTTRKVCAVLANDLNPHSYRYLLENYTLNNRSKTKSKEIEYKKSLIRNSTKMPEPLIKTDEFKFNPIDSFTAFNLDGNDFIRKKLKYHLVEILNYRLFNKIELELGKFYVLMNLPAMSVDFLDSFNNLYDPKETQLIKDKFDENFLKKFRLNIYCYHFAKTENDDLKNIQQRIIKEIFKDESISIDSKFVRKVAPNKDMFCSMFQIKFSNFFASSETNISADNREKKKLIELDNNSSDESVKKILKKD